MSTLKLVFEVSNTLPASFAGEIVNRLDFTFTDSTGHTEQFSEAYGGETWIDLPLTFEPAAGEFVITLNLFNQRGEQYGQALTAVGSDQRDVILTPPVVLTAPTGFTAVLVS